MAVEVNILVYAATVIVVAYAGIKLLGHLLGSKLASFGTERMIAAGELAKAATMQELQDTKTLRDLLGAIWDAVSLELDDGQVTAENNIELERMV